MGLVGFGFAAKTIHAPLIKSSGMTIAGVVTRQEAAVRAMLPSAAVHPTLESLLTMEPLDAIVIATPNHLHAQQALMSLARCKHVVVDKPLTLTLADTDALIEAASISRCKLAVFHNRRWDSDFLTIRRLIADGSLRSVTSYEATWNRYRPEIKDRWKERALLGGGVLFDLGPHLIDQVLCLFGMPEWVQADVFAQREGATVDDGFEILMGLGRLRIRLGASSLVADHTPRYRIHGNGGSYSKGGLDVQEAQLRGGESPSSPTFGLEPPSQWGRFVDARTQAEKIIPAKRGNWLRFYQLFRDSMESGAPVPVPATAARDVLEIIEAARYSSENGRRIQLGRGDRPLASKQWHRAGSEGA